MVQTESFPTTSNRLKWTVIKVDQQTLGGILAFLLGSVVTNSEHCRVFALKLGLG